MLASRLIRPTVGQLTTKRSVMVECVEVVS